MGISCIPSLRDPSLRNELGMNHGVSFAISESFEAYPPPKKKKNMRGTQKPKLLEYCLLHLSIND